MTEQSDQMEAAVRTLSEITGLREGVIMYFVARLWADHKLGETTLQDLARAKLPTDLDIVRRRFDAAMAEIAPYFAQPGDEGRSDIELLESSTEMTQDETPDDIASAIERYVSDQDGVLEKLEPFDMQAALGLSDREWVLMRTKWVVVSDIRRMLEDAGIDAVALAGAAGEDAVQVERWLRGVVRHVSLDTLTVLYAAAAEKAEWPDLEWVIRGLPESSQ